MDAPMRKVIELERQVWLAPPQFKLLMQGLSVTPPPEQLHTEFPTLISPPDPHPPMLQVWPLHEKLLRGQPDLQVENAVAISLATTGSLHTREVDSAEISKEITSLPAKLSWKVSYDVQYSDWDDTVPVGSVCSHSKTSKLIGKLRK